MKRKYNLLIGERTSEQIKIEIGSAYPLGKPLTMEIKGRSLIEGVPKTVTLNDSEIREALSESVSTIVSAIRVALERTPPELSGDISDRGIVLAGGGALLKNLDKRIREETGLSVSIADDPLCCVVTGAGKILTDFNCCGKFRSNRLHASLIRCHARLGNVKNVSAEVSERHALSNLIRFSRSRDPIMKYDSFSTLTSLVDVGASLAGLEHRRDVPLFPIISDWERSQNLLKRLLSCVGMSKLLEWFLRFLATMASSHAEDRRLAKDGGEVRIQVVYAYYVRREALTK